MAKYFTNLLCVFRIPVHKKIARRAIYFVVDDWGFPRTARKSRRLRGIRSRMPLAYCTRILLKCSLTHCQTPRGGFRPTSPYTKKSPDGRFILWWMLRDSNPRPSRCKRDALIN